MKTITEFPGVALREALKIRQTVLAAQAALRRTQSQAASESKTAEAVDAPAQSVESKPEQAVSDVPSGVAVETSPDTDAGMPSDASMEVAEGSAAVVSDASATGTDVAQTAMEGPGVEETPKVQAGGRIIPLPPGAPRPKIKPSGPKPMTEEEKAELSKAFQEKLKMEGEKLTYLQSALSFVDPRRQADLRRVVVLSLSEGEKAPMGAKQEGDKYFLAEYLAPLHAPRGRHHQEGGPGRGRSGRGDKRRDRGARPGRGEGRSRRPDQGGHPSGEGSGSRADRRPGRSPGGRRDTPRAPKTEGPRAVVSVKPKDSASGGTGASRPIPRPIPVQRGNPETPT